MILERIPSRAAALRNPYCLSVEFMALQEVPEPLNAYYRSPYRIEVHTLYEEGAESRRQWIFRNEQGKTALVSSLRPLPPEEPSLEDEDAPVSLEPDGDSPPEETRFTGFIELYEVLNGSSVLREEHLLVEDGTETITTYFYNQQLLIRAETRLKMPRPLEAEGAEESEAPGEEFELVFSDYYRYSRSHALRAVERVYHQDSPGGAAVSRVGFPHLGLQAAVEAQKKEFVSPSTAYGSEFMQELAVETFHVGDRVRYTTDERGRILTEIAEDENGAVLKETHNTWEGDRLASVDWKAGEDAWCIEYAYDEKGDRILERNYRNGVLERLVRKDQGQEIEELYMNERLVLRAVWEGGRKISEEHPSGGLNSASGRGGKETERPRL
jgi:hypothetical protein